MTSKHSATSPLLATLPSTSGVNLLIDELNKTRVGTEMIKAKGIYLRVFRAQVECDCKYIGNKCHDRDVQIGSVDVILWWKVD